MLVLGWGAYRQDFVYVHKILRKQKEIWFGNRVYMGPIEIGWLMEKINVNANAMKREDWLRTKAILILYLQR